MILNWANFLLIQTKSIISCLVYKIKIKIELLFLMMETMEKLDLPKSIDISIAVLPYSIIIII